MNHCWRNEDNAAFARNTNLTVAAADDLLRAGFSGTELALVEAAMQKKWLIAQDSKSPKEFGRDIALGERKCGVKPANAQRV